MKKGLVSEVHPTSVLLNDGSSLEYGVLVWSTGVGPCPFVKSLPFPKAKGGR